MTKIAKSILDNIQQSNNLEALQGSLQYAIELEHATIPTYLTAMLSLKPGTNREIWHIIHSVVIEEMLHMAIAANILNAIGGKPQINGPHFIPTYPGPLPKGIGDDLIVTLGKYDESQVRNVFMRIEEPESKVIIEDALSTEQEIDYSTIGEFYDAIQKKFNAFSSQTLPGDPALQFTSPFFKSEHLFPIKTPKDAINAIEIIKLQGEGTSKSPLDDEDNYAHFYLFQELAEGRKIKPDPTSESGYSFSGPKIPFDSSAVWNIKPNTKVEDLPENTEVSRQANQFNFVYAKLLNGLHRTFNGDVGFFENTIGLMFDLKLVGEKLVSMDYPGTENLKVGPPFQYVNINR